MLVPSSKKWRVKRHPRFTVLDFGEYMAADPAPRETILRDMKYERIGRTLIYDRLRRAIPRFLTSPIRDRGILAECRADLARRKASATSPQQAENLTYEMRALEAFENSVNALEMGGLNFDLASAASPIRVEGVSVSVQPTSHIRVRRPRGVDLAGALIVDTAKGQIPKTDKARSKLTNGMQYAAIMLHQYAIREFPGADPRASADHCIIFHTNRPERVTAPDPYRRLYRDIEAECRNIARAWPTIPEPPGYDSRDADLR